MNWPAAAGVALLADSLRRVIAARDSTIATLAKVAHSITVNVPAPNVSVQAPTESWWHSSIIATLIGGLLAIASGLAAPFLRDWLNKSRLKRRLLTELDLLAASLEGLLMNVQAEENDLGAIGSFLQELRSTRVGFDQSMEEMARLLPPQARRDMIFWYENLGHMITTVQMALADRSHAEGHGVDVEAVATVVLRRTRESIVLVLRQCNERREMLRRA